MEVSIRQSNCKFMQFESAKTKAEDWQKFCKHCNECSSKNSIKLCSKIRIQKFKVVVHFRDIRVLYNSANIASYPRMPPKSSKPNRVRVAAFFGLSNKSAQFLCVEKSKRITWGECFRRRSFPLSDMQLFASLRHSFETRFV